MELKEIQKILKSKAKKKDRESTIRFVPTAKKVYGVKAGILNDIVKRVKKSDFDLIEKLWESGAFEERLLAGKILSKISKKDSDKTLRLIKRFSTNISDWAICDILGTQSVRKIVKEKPKEIFKLSEELINSKNLWQRRLAIVLLIELNRQGFSKEKIKKLANKVKEDKEYYVRRVLVWLKNELAT